MLFRSVATTVIIESQRPARIALPVQQPMIAVRPLRRPSIARITSDAGEGAPIMTSENLVIEGTALDAEFVRVTSGGADVTDAITLRRDDRIEVTLATATGLRAGRQAVQVTHLTDLPPNDRTIAESNAMAYTLHPAVAATVVASAADPTDNALRTGSIQLTFDPLVTAGQRIMMLLNERAPAAGAAARAYSFPAPPGNGIVAPATDAATVVVRFNRVAPGSYLVRVDVDGAASVLEIAGGSYAKPAVAV